MWWTYTVWEWLTMNHGAEFERKKAEIRMWKEQGDLFNTEHEIEMILGGVENLHAFTNGLVVDAEAVDEGGVDEASNAATLADIRDRMRDIVNRSIPIEWTWNKIQKKADALQTLFISSALEEDWVYHFWDALFDIMVSKVPWFDFRGKRVMIEESDVIFFDESWNEETQRYGLYDFYKYIFNAE